MLLWETIGCPNKIMIRSIKLRKTWNSSCSDAQKLWIGCPIQIVQISTQSKIYGNFKESCRETSQQTVSKKKAITKDSFREIIQKEWGGVKTETFVLIWLVACQEDWRK